MSEDDKRELHVDLPWIQDGTGPHIMHANNRRNQNLQAKYIRVMHNQNSTYSTGDPATYNDLYVATQPFMTR